MAEPAGFVYRNAAASTAALRELLQELRHGWVWSPEAYRATTDPALLLAGAERRACRVELEVRWRRAAAAYDVLLLALTAQERDGFTPLPATGGGWRTRPLPILDLDGRSRRATGFLTPDGAIQFIALIGGVQREGDGDG